MSKKILLLFVILCCLTFYKAHAIIIYHSVNYVDSIGLDTAMHYHYPIDFNKDGIDDVFINFSYGGQFSNLSTPDYFFAYKGTNSLAQEYSMGSPIDKTSSFANYTNLMWDPFGSSTQTVTPDTPIYLGFEYTDGSNTWYGWMQIKLSYNATTHVETFDFIDYAYETEAGVAIAAGDRGTVTGITTSNEQGISLFPTLAGTGQTIEVGETVQTLIVTDLTGKVLISENSVSSFIANLRSGVYVVKTEKGTQRLVIE